MEVTLCNKVSKTLPSQRFLKRSCLGPKISSCFYTRNSLYKSSMIRLKSKPWNHNPLAFANDQEDCSNTIDKGDEEEDISRETLIWRAIKLPMYTVVPVLVGSAAAFSHAGIFLAGRHFLLLAPAVLIASWLNLSHPIITSRVLSSSLLVSFTTALKLLCINFHQVRIGTKCAKVVKQLIVVLYVLACAFGFSRILPLTCVFLCSLTLPMAKLVVGLVEENHGGKRKIFMAKYYCVRLRRLFGVALARMIPIRYNQIMIIFLEVWLDFVLRPNY